MRVGGGTEGHQSRDRDFFEKGGCVVAWLDTYQPLVPGLDLAAQLVRGSHVSLALLVSCTLPNEAALSVGGNALI